MRIVALPETLPEGMGTRELFNACLGRVFPIAGFERGLIELHVGKIVGEPDDMHSMWIEQNCIEPERR